MLSVFTMALTWVQTRFSGEKGQDLIEYVMLSGIIAAIVAGVVTVAFTGALDSFFDGVADCIDFNASTPCNP